MSSKTLKPIGNILDTITNSLTLKKTEPSVISTSSLPSNSKTFQETTNTYNIPSFNSTFQDITSSIPFKIIIILLVILFGMIAYTYLEKEITQLIEKIKEYLEIKKYTKEERKIEKEKQAKEKEQEKTIENESPEEVIENTQQVIKEQKKNPTYGGVQPITQTLTTTHLAGTEIEKEIEQENKDALQKALNDATKNTINDNVVEGTSISTGKRGWCLIGGEKGDRTCLEIGANDICMSGDIYPTRDVCINPRLRA